MYYKNFVDPKTNFLDFLKISDLPCNCNSRVLFEKVLNPYSLDTDNVMAYNSCMHTIIAAGKRQMKKAPTPDPLVADEFLQYAKNKIDEEVGDELRHFSYSYQDWYHHLTAVKQRDMDLYVRYVQGDSSLTHEEIETCRRNYYDGICKVEIQEADGKPRMVCSLPLETKFTMGPITWQLEELFQDKFKGYCGGKNLQQMGDKINEYIDQGFTKVVAGDGSAFDNTQDITLKRVDQYIYSLIEDKVHHVPKETFHRIATENYKTMVLSYVDQYTKKQIKLLKYKILGTVFSGDCDTTLCNTIRMALYNRFVNDKAGLEYGKDYIVFSKGDDFTVMYKPYVTDEFINNLYYKYFIKCNKDKTKPNTEVYGLGQVLKMLNIGKTNTFIFCSLRSWYLDQSENHVYLTRDPKKLYNLSQYSRKTKNYNSVQRYIYCKDLATDYRINYPGIKLFDLIAQAYDEQADRIYTKYGKTTKFKKCMMRYLTRESKMKSRLKDMTSRKTISELMPQEDKLYSLLYDIGHRKFQYKIIKDYWTTMQKIEKRQTFQLTKEQVDYINYQMLAEFDIEELKSVLGLKK